MLRLFLIFVLLFSSVHADSFSLFRTIGKQIVKAVSKPKKPINYHLRNRKHPQTRVRYNKKGYPLFSKVATCDMKLSWYERNFDKLRNPSTVRNKHFRICSRQLYRRIRNNPTLRKRFTPKQIAQLRNGKTPDGYTWHHEPETNILSLVDREVHAQTKHSGGFSLFH